MQLNLPPKVRATIYVVIVLGTALIVPLNAGGVASDLLLKVWSSLAGAASLLAALNVTPDAQG